MTVLRNAYVPIERGAKQDLAFWARRSVRADSRTRTWRSLPRIRNQANEPVILMCHAPDYVDQLRMQPAGQAVSLVLSGHTHGGQMQLPVIGPLWLPPGGRKYVQGLSNWERRNST